MEGGHKVLNAVWIEVRKASFLEQKIRQDLGKIEGYYGSDGRGLETNLRWLYFIQPGLEPERDMVPSFVWVSRQMRLDLRVLVGGGPAPTGIH